MIEKFYGPFHIGVTKTSETAERQNAERLLGNDPETGLPVYVKVGRFGPFAQIGENSEEGKEKPRYDSLRSRQLIETITLDEAMDLFKLPRVIGSFEGKDMKAAIGRFGPYIMHDSKFISIPKTDDVFSITTERAIELIESKRISDANKLVKVFSEDENIKILNGRWGPYISRGKDNFKIPKTKKADELQYSDVLEIIKAEGKPETAAKAANKTAAKKVAVKKTPAKKTAAKKTAVKKAK